MAIITKLTERVANLEAEVAELRKQIEKPAPKPAPSPKAKTD